MGVYAQTNFEIECKNNKSAKAVLKKLKEMNKKGDEYGNSFGMDLEVDFSSVLGFESSGRIQNLEFRCEKIWEAIKDIDGVLEFRAPFMSEADGAYYTNEK